MVSGDILHVKNGEITFKNFFGEKKKLGGITLAAMNTILSQEIMREPVRVVCIFHS